jgi:hypothetical protein
MSEDTNQSKHLAKEPSGAESYGLESLREKILHKIEDTQDAATLRKVWSLLTHEASEAKPLHLARHIETIFDQYDETLAKLAK